MGLLLWTVDSWPTRLVGLLLNSVRVVCFRDVVSSYTDHPVQYGIDVPDATKEIEDAEFKKAYAALESVNLERAGTISSAEPQDETGILSIAKAVVGKQREYREHVKKLLAVKKAADTKLRNIQKRYEETKKTTERVKSTYDQVKETKHANERLIEKLQADAALLVNALKYFISVSSAAHTQPSDEELKVNLSHTCFVLATPLRARVCEMCMACCRHSAFAPTLFKLPPSARASPSPLLTLRVTSCYAPAEAADPVRLLFIWCTPPTHGHLQYRKEVRGYGEKFGLAKQHTRTFEHQLNELRSANTKSLMQISQPCAICSPFKRPYKYLLMVTENDVVKIETATGRDVQWYPCEAKNPTLDCFIGPTDVKIVHSDKFFLTANCGAGNVVVTDLQTNVSTILSGQYKAPRAIAATMKSDGNFALIVDGDASAGTDSSNSLQIYQVLGVDGERADDFTCRAVRVHMPESTGPACAIAVATDGKFAVIGCGKTGKHKGSIYRVDLQKDGNPEPASKATRLYPPMHVTSEDAPIEIEPAGLTLDPANAYALFTNLRCTAPHHGQHGGDGRTRHKQRVGRINFRDNTVTFPYSGFQDPRGIVIPSKGGYALVADYEESCIKEIVLPQTQSGVQHGFGGKIKDSKRKKKEAEVEVAKLRILKDRLEKDLDRHERTSKAFTESSRISNTYE